jgi:hypothetical protein
MGTKPLTNETPSRHTPGDWKVEIPDDRADYLDDIFVTSGEGQYTVAAAQVEDVGREAAMHNAYLIAAAPRMYAALKEVEAVLMPWAAYISGKGDVPEPEDLVEPLVDVVNALGKVEYRPPGRPF